MIMTEKIQDMFSLDVSTVVCPVNLQGVMGNGLAVYCKNRYKGLESFYRFACKSGMLAYGKCCSYPLSDSKNVLLVPTKINWRNDSTLDIVEMALMDIWLRHDVLSIKSLAIPAIGCGKGKLKYDDVRVLLRRYLNTVDIPVHICLT